MKRKIKNILFSVCIGASVLSCALPTAECFQTLRAENKFVAASSKNGQDVAWSALAIENNYAFGTVFSVPQRTLTVNGVQVSAKAVLEYPDGTTTVNDTVKLTVGGNYTLRYTAVVAGKTYLDERSFFVAGAQVSVQNEKSSFDYGAYTYNVDRTALIDENGAPLSTSESGDTGRVQYTYTCEEGLMVRLARGDTLTFHEIIDLSDVTQTDSLIKAFATPDEQGTPDFEKLVFTFTDVYDPSITLRFVSRHTQEGYDYRKTYSLVAGNGQKESGLDYMNPNNMYVGKWGTSGDGSYTRRFKSLYKNANGVWVDDYREQDQMPIDFRFDSQTKTAYLRDYRNATRINTIADLDNPEHFDTLWSGFTDGKVRLSITADVYTGDTANFCVTHVHGLDLTKTQYVDTQAPVLTIDNDYESMPKAMVGGKYPVPTATAFDLNVGKCQVKTSVWYNYTSANAKSVLIKDGWFETAKYGDYAIVYETNDGNGNANKEILWVRAEKQLPSMQIHLPTDKKTEAVCGEWIMPVDCEIENAVGRDSDVKISVKAVINGEEMDADNGFRPEQAGEYKIVYSAVDYLGRITETYYTIQVDKGDQPIFVDAPNFPFAFISGMEYVMPNVYVNDYTGNGVKRELAYAELTDKNGTRRIESGETFTPEVAKQGDTVNVVYKYAYQGAILESATYTIPVTVQMGKNESGKNRLFISNYLLGNGFTTETKRNEIIVTATESDGSWTFAKELIANGSSVKMRGGVNTSFFDGLSITLTDSLSKQEQIRIYVQNLSDSMMFYVGNDTIKINNGFNNGGGFTIRYENGTVVIGSTRINVKTYVSGEAFAGFSSEKVLLGVAFDNAKAGAQYSLEELWGETTGTLSSDKSSPNIVVFGDYGGLKKFGETIVLPYALASDLLDPNITFSVTVTCPDRTVAKDIYGNELKDVNPNLEYTISLQQYGQYMVNYTASDTAENENTWSYPILVKDETPPTLTFKGKTNTQAKVGDTLVLPEFTVQDNVTASEELEIIKFVYAPNGQVYELSQTGNSILCAQSGVYEFRVMVMDAEGNLSLYIYAVTVSE